MSPAQMTAWFEPRSMTLDVGNADVVFGGTHLLLEFLQSASGIAGYRQVSLVAPFLDRALIEQESFFSLEGAKLTDLLLITTPVQEHGPAMEAVLALPWRSCEVLILKHLHSKVYVAQPEQGSSFALLGSHNLTAAAAARNYEIGVLVHGRSDNTRTIISGLQEHVAALRARSRRTFDSTLCFTHAAA